MLTASSVFVWPSGEPDQPPPVVPFEPIPLSADERDYQSPAVDAFADFVTAVNRGSVAEVEALLADELPDVVGLGTITFPRLPADPGIWRDGLLEPARVAAFVGAASSLQGDVWISECTGFADGPLVVVASCRFEATRGFRTQLGLSEQQGHLFGFMVDGKVAGLAART